MFCYLPDYLWNRWLSLPVYWWWWCWGRSREQSTEQVSSKMVVNHSPHFSQGPFRGEGGGVRVLSSRSPIPSFRWTPNVISGWESTHLCTGTGMHAVLVLCYILWWNQPYYPPCIYTEKYMNNIDSSVKMYVDLIDDGRWFPVCMN